MCLARWRATAVERTMLKALQRVVPLHPPPLWARSFFTLPVPKSLDEVVKLQLFRRAPPDEQSRLWFERFAPRDDVATSVMPHATYMQVERNAQACPHFLIPVTKPPEAQHDDTCFVNFFAQFQGPSLCLITTLEAMKAHGDSAALCPPAAILSIYPDLGQESGNVFLRCDTLDKALLNKRELRYCIDYLSTFYTDANLYRRWVDPFNQDSRRFDFSSFLQCTRSLRHQLRLANTSL